MKQDNKLTPAASPSKIVSPARPTSPLSGKTSRRESGSTPFPWITSTSATYPFCERPTPPSAQADKSRYSTSSCAARDGRDMQKAEKYKQWLEGIGFVDVVDVELVVPGNAWPEDDRMREIGRHLVQVQPGPLLSLGSYFGARDLSGVLDGLAPDMVRDMEDESTRLCWPM
ncbi:hypothetical protein E5D57_012991 [Metarhizium anisopliae]|nr:hypothetical protein E5D57_012991 [Metarhizium anisopliae]